MAETKSNSRFFTNCYHQAAAIERATGCKQECAGKMSLSRAPTNAPTNASERLVVRTAVSTLSDGGNAAGNAARRPRRSYSQSCGSHDRLRGHRRLAGNRRVLRAETVASVKIARVLFNTLGIAVALAGFH